MPRFAILEHEWDGVHWDLLFERDGTLATWAIDAPLGTAPDQPARVLPDHRLLYLTYEGPVSGDRGAVRRVAEGTYSVVSWGPDLVVLRLSGARLSGDLVLRRGESGAWSLRLGN